MTDDMNKKGSELRYVLIWWIKKMLYIATAPTPYKWEKGNKMMI